MIKAELLEPLETVGGAVYAPNTDLLIDCESALQLEAEMQTIIGGLRDEGITYEQMTDLVRSVYFENDDVMDYVNGIKKTSRS